MEDTNRLKIKDYSVNSINAKKNNAYQQKNPHHLEEPYKTAKIC